MMYNFQYMVLTTGLLAYFFSLNVFLSIATAYDTGDDKSISKTHSFFPESLEQHAFQSCGTNSLYVIAKMRGLNPDFDALKRSLEPDPHGSIPLGRLEQTARSIGLDPLTIRTDLAGLSKIPSPSIAFIQSKTSGRNQPGHYVVLLGVFSNQVAILDPPQIAQLHGMKYFEDNWSGIVTLFPNNVNERHLFDSSQNTFIFNIAVAAFLYNIILLALLIFRARIAHRRSYFITSAFFVLLFITTGCGGSAQRTDPVLELKQREIDLGIVEPGQHPFSLPIYNNGTIPIEFERIVSSCSCTIPIKPSPLQPHKDGFITGSIKVIPGPGRATIILYGTTFEGGIPINILWNGKVPPTLLPSQLAVNIMRGKSTIENVELSVPGFEKPTSLKLLRVTGLPSWIKTELVTTTSREVSENNGAFLRFVFNAPNQTSIQKFTVEILISYSDKLFNLSLPISVDVNEGLRSIPSTLHLSGKLSDLPAIKGVVTIINETNLPLRIDNHEIWLDVSLDSAEPSRPIRTLKIGANASLNKGLSKSVITLKDTKDHAVNINVIVFVSE